MNQNKLYSRVYAILKSAIAAAVVPILFVYIMIAKPDYRVMNAMAHVVVPVARWTGGVITWPVRAGGHMIGNIRELGRLRAENADLRAALDAANARMHECDVAIFDAQKLARELDIVRDIPHGAVIADVTHDSTAFNHNMLFINRGTRDGVAPGMAVISTDDRLVGVIADAGAHFARVRTLRDSDMSVAVRVAGSDVFGFVTGSGARRPTIGFFSDPQFQATAGIKLVTSSIGGMLPAGVFVGTLVGDKDVEIADPGSLGRVLVLQFDRENKYE